MQSLLIRSHEFSQDPGIVMVTPGQTIKEMLTQACGGEENLATDLEVRVGGHVVPVQYWDHLRPKEGAAIQVTRLSLSGKNVKMAIAIVIIVVATIFQQHWASNLAYAWGGSAAAWSAGIMLVATLAVSALMKPPSAGGGGNEQAAKWNALTGSSNQINPWGAIPIVVGESRFFPPHAAIPYSQALGQNSYQYCLFDLGYGDIEVSDIRIGDTPLSQYKDVQYEITKTPTLYTSDVAELAVSANMLDGDSIIRNTADGVTRISLDLVAGQGLYGVGTSGKKFLMWVTWTFEYRLAGSTGAWLTPDFPSLSGLTPTFFLGQYEVRAENVNAFACGIAWDVPAGQYEVRVKRVDSLRGSSRNTYVDSFTWTVLRSIKPGPPSTTGTNKLAMRIKATDQLNGTLQSLSCLVKQKIKAYDRSTNTWSAPSVNLNPAWVAYWMLTECPAIVSRISADRINLDTFADYAEYCDLNSFEARGVVDSVTTAAVLIENILACSLGSLGRRDGKYSIVFDTGETLPSMSFSPLEISEFTMSRPFINLPQALRVQFKNPEADYQQDEIIVLDDGYSYRGVDARGNPSTRPEPSEFETIELQFAQDSKHAWRVGRFHLAQGKFRPETYSFSSDVAGLGTTRGDVVDVAHDLVEWGSGWGRVQTIGYNSQNKIIVTLDQMVTTNVGKTYQAQFRNSVGQTTAVEVKNPGGETNTFELSSLPTGIVFGDACIIGESENVTEKLLITGVNYSDGGQVTNFLAVRYDERVAPFWQNPPDSIVSEITGGIYEEVPVPVITGVVSDHSSSDTDDAGITIPSIRISVNKNSEFDRMMQL